MSQLIAAAFPFPVYVNETGGHQLIASEVYTNQSFSLSSTPQFFAYEERKWYETTKNDLDSWFANRTNLVIKVGGLPAGTPSWFSFEERKWDQTYRNDLDTWLTNRANLVIKVGGLPAGTSSWFNYEERKWSETYKAPPDAWLTNRANLVIEVGGLPAGTSSWFNYEERKWNETYFRPIQDLWLIARNPNVLLGSQFIVNYYVRNAYGLY